MEHLSVGLLSVVDGSVEHLSVGRLSMLGGSVEHLSVGWLSVGWWRTCRWVDIGGRWSMACRRSVV